jgi:uncharacterized protein YcfJ
MNDDQKKSDETDPLLALEGFLRQSFDAAKAQTGVALDTLSNGLHATIKTGENAVKGAYNLVENTVGKDRVLGAVVGAKIGGTVGMVGGVPGMIKGGAVGTVAGFIGGRKFVEWYERKDREKADEEKAKEEAKKSLEENKVILLPPPKP